MNNKIELSVVIPAYNEEKRILPTLQNYYELLKKEFGKNFEIIVVPNNCSDNTLGIVQNFSKQNTQTKSINFQYYIGKGGAVMRGFQISKGNFIGFTDADNSTDPENFLKLYKNKKDFDGVIASRRLKGAVIYPPRKIHQDLSSYFFNKEVNLLFNLKFKDTQCGAKLFNKKAAELLTRNYSEIGWIFDVDLLNICKKNNFRILECPIQWSDSEGSHLSTYKGFLAALELLRFRFRNKKLNSF
ncbi:MAG: glycosyltransferase [archaeon]